MSAPRTILLAMVLSLLAPACGVQANSPSSDAQPTAEETSGSRQGNGVSGGNHAEDRPDDRSGNRADRGGGRPEDRAGDPRRGGEREVRSATLHLSGDRGTGFSGLCRVGERETELAGTVPETVELELDGAALECSVENAGPGSLEADLSVGNAHYTQRTAAGGADLNFALSGARYTSSTSSVTAVEAETPDAVSNASSRAVAGPQDRER